MRVDSINKIKQVYNTNSSRKINSVTKANEKDALVISQTGRDLQIAKQAVAKASDVRMDKVNDIKQRLASGTYNIQANEVADKLVDKYFEASI